MRSTLIIASFTVVACGLVDRRESIVRESLTQRMASESEGALTLAQFQKTNGYDQQAQGLQLYVLEWQGDIIVQREVWKGGDALAGYWRDFSALPGRPAGFSGNAWKHFSKGAIIHFIGDATLLKTDKGWRVQQIAVKTSQLTNPIIDVLGKWAGYYSPGAGQPFEDAPSWEYLIVEDSGKLKVTARFLKDGKPFSWLGAFADGKITLVGADGRPAPPDPVTGPGPEITLLSDGSLRLFQEGEIRLRRTE